MLYILVKLISRVVCMLPDMARYKLGVLLGELCWPIVPRKRREMAVNNIMISLGVDKSRAEQIAKKSATRFGRMFIEVLSLPRIKDNIRKYVLIEGQEHLEGAMAYGCGVVIATAHTGNWELLGVTLAKMGFPLVGVAQKQTNAAMDRFINEYRTLTGMHVTYKSGVRDMIRLLGEGKIIGLLMDQDAGPDGVFVEFFGRPASTPQGAAALARMKDAPIVPVFITEVGEGLHKVIIYPPVWVDKTDNRERDILVTTQRLTHIVEQHIRKYPHEWFWLHNRWKWQPNPTV